jgi:hypothetical protein
MKIINVNIVEMERYYTGKALVIYMDLLGFSKAVNEKWPSTIEPLGSFIKKLISDRACCIASVEKDLTIFKQKAIAISDSTFIFQKIKNEKPLDSIVTIHQLLTICYLAWRFCIANGFTVRGGIAYDEIHWDEKLNHLQGPAIVSAAKLEQQANWSRILCSEHFVKFYAELHIKHKISSEKYIPLRYLSINSDKKITINPRLLREASKDDSSLEENDESVKEELTELMSDQNEYIQSKYQPLIDAISGKSVEKIPTIDDLLTYNIKYNI